MKYVFIVTADDRAQIARVRAFAEDPAHYFRAGDPVPGEPYQCVLGVVPLLCTKVTYTISLCERAYTGELIHVRQATMGWTNYGKPTVVSWPIVEECARLFGFTGSKETWQLEPFPHDKLALVILQPYEAETKRDRA